MEITNGKDTVVLLSHGYDREHIRMKVKKNGLAYTVTAKLDYASTSKDTFVWYAGNHRLADHQQEELNKLVQEVQSERERRAVKGLNRLGQRDKASHD